MLCHTDDLLIYLYEITTIYLCHTDELAALYYEHRYEIALGFLS